MLLARCSRERVAGEVRPLTGERRQAVLADVDRLADQALRTLAVAYRRHPTSPTGGPAGRRRRGGGRAGLSGSGGIVDPPRPEAAAAVAEARRAGVRTVMITGDHPRTAARIAAELGIVDGRGRACMTGAELAALDADELAATVRGGVGVRPGGAGAQAAHRRGASRPAATWWP